MESSYMGGLDGSDPLGKAVIWSRTEEDVNRLNEYLHQQEQEQVPFSPLPTRSSTTSTTTSTTSAEDTETTSWDELGLDSYNDTLECFHVLYTGHGSPPTKAKVRQSLAQAMSTYYTTIQHHRHRQMWRQQQYQQNSTKPNLPPRQRFNVVTSGTLDTDTDTYEDNGLALLETDATWTIPSMSILLSPLVTDDSSKDADEQHNGDNGDNDNDDDDDNSLRSHYLPQNLHTEILPRLETMDYHQNNALNPPIDLVIYFCNQRTGPLEQDFAALSKLQLPVLPLIINSPSSSQPALPIPVPSTSDPDYPPSLSSSFSSSSSQLVNIQTKKAATTPEPEPTSTLPYLSASSMLLRNTIATYLQRYHIHCFNVTEIHPEVPGFITNASNKHCPDGNFSSLCHILSADEIMHVDQFTSLDTRVTYKLMTNVRKYKEKWNQLKQQQQQHRQQTWYWLFRRISTTAGRWKWILFLVILGWMVLGGLQWMHILEVWTQSDVGGDRNFTAAASPAGVTPPLPLASGFVNRFDEEKMMMIDVEVEEYPLSDLPHMMMAPGYEYPDADMYHRFTLEMTANSVDMDINDDSGDERGHDSSGSARKGARQMVMNQARLVWDQGGVWTLTKTDWTAHVPSPCKMNWDTDMNLTLWINTNIGDGAGGGHWQRTTHLFTLAWTPCNQRHFEHTYYPHEDDAAAAAAAGDGDGGDIESGLGSDHGSASYFALTPYQHDVLHQWWLQIKAWTRIGMHSLVDGAKKLQTMKNSLYDYLLQ